MKIMHDMGKEVHIVHKQAIKIKIDVSMLVGLKGENLKLQTLDGSSSVEWAEGSLLATKQPLTWYKTTFNAPAGNDPLALFFFWLILLSHLSLILI
ncbi:unnamed protein product [Camellia sinensis]